MKLARRVALITGAGSGIGRATALLFAEEGAKIVVADIDGKAAGQTVELIEKRGGAATSVEADVTKASGAARMISAAVETYGALDILLNNAGWPMLPTPVVDLDEALWDKIMAVNVKGIFLGAKYAIPVMKKQGKGVIINMASIAGKFARAGSSAYNTSKAAAIMLTKVLALEGAPEIRVNCISPGVADTPMLPRLGVGTKQAVDDFVAQIPLRRLVQPTDVAHAALYLASDDSSMSTGISLDVAGGRGL
jgi:3-oxoacyl-[acyl-carrier protein] reductase